MGRKHRASLLRLPRHSWSRYGSPCDSQICHRSHRNLAPSTQICILPRPRDTRGDSRFSPKSHWPTRFAWSGDWRPPRTQALLSFLGEITRETYGKAGPHVTWSCSACGSSSYQTTPPQVFFWSTTRPRYRSVWDTSECVQPCFPFDEFLAVSTPNGSRALIRQLCPCGGYWPVRTGKHCHFHVCQFRFDGWSSRGRFDDGRRILPATTTFRRSYRSEFAIPDGSDWLARYILTWYVTSASFWRFFLFSCFRLRLDGTISAKLWPGSQQPCCVRPKYGLYDWPRE